MLSIPGHGAFSESLLSQDTKQARARELLRNTSNKPQASEITVTIWRTFKISRIMISHHDGSAFPRPYHRVLADQSGLALTHCESVVPYTGLQSSVVTHSTYILN